PRSSIRHSRTARRSRPRSGAASAPRTPRLLLHRQVRQLRPHLPELRVEAPVDQRAEELDRSALGADDLAADDPLDDLEVLDAPDRAALVELRQRLGELVEILELAPSSVHVYEREAGFAAEDVKGLSEARRDAAQPVPAGRVEAGAVAEQRPHLRGVLP